jgi:DNA-binding response OmpR family regulator
LFEQLKPLLVALDWNLPDTTGYHLCQEMQHRTNVFAIVLSSRTDEADKVKVLSASAENYICKPFGLAELAIRIEVVLRRLRPVTRSRIVFDWFALDSARREATLNDRIIKLIALEFNIFRTYATDTWRSLRSPLPITLTRPIRLPVDKRSQTWC